MCALCKEQAYSHVVCSGFVCVCVCHVRCARGYKGDMSVCVRCYVCVCVMYGYYTGVLYVCPVRCEKIVCVSCQAYVCVCVL